jgi:hypothetical protein
MPSVIKMIKSRIRWAEYVAYMRRKRNACSIFVGTPEGIETTRKT